MEVQNSETSPSPRTTRKFTELHEELSLGQTVQSPNSQHFPICTNMKSESYKRLFYPGHFSV